MEAAARAALSPDVAWVGCRGAVRHALVHWSIQALFSAAIFVNIVVLAIDYYEAPEAVHQFISITNTVCLAVFLMEIAMKWCAHGICQYFRVPFNILDFLLVLMSCVEFALLRNGTLSSLRSLKGIKVLRLLLIARLAHRIRAVSLLLGVFSLSTPLLPCPGDLLHLDCGVML